MVRSRPARPIVIEEASPVRPRYPSREVVKRITRQDRQIVGCSLLPASMREVCISESEFSMQGGDVRR
jgi:hypothetical protein